MPIDVILKSSRRPSLALTVSAVNATTTTIEQLKKWIQDDFSEGEEGVTVPSDKIKILHNKKPVPASIRTVEDLLKSSGSQSGGVASLELGVMVLTSAPDRPPRTIHPATDHTATATSAPAISNTGRKYERAVPNDPSQGPAAENLPSASTGAAALETSKFWTDLHGFVSQRLKDEGLAQQIVERWSKDYEVDPQA